LLIAAINATYTSGESIKYVRKTLMASDSFHKKVRTFEQVQLLASQLERVTKKDKKSFWQVFAAQAAAGKFNDLEPFKGLVMAFAVRNKQESSGKALTGV
jgi:predicted amidophosphoribosyltransferase